MPFPVPQSIFFRSPCPTRLKRPIGSRACLPLAMASLERLWKEGRDGALSPLEQMRAWALRTAQRDIGGDKAANLEKIADRVTKVGGGIPPVKRSASSSSGWTRTRSGFRERTTVGLDGPGWGLMVAWLQKVHDHSLRSLRFMKQ